MLVCVKNRFYIQYQGHNKVEYKYNLLHLHSLLCILIPVTNFNITLMHVLVQHLYVLKYHWIEKSYSVKSLHGTSGNVYSVLECINCSQALRPLEDKKLHCWFPWSIPTGLHSDSTNQWCMCLCHWILYARRKTNIFTEQMRLTVFWTFLYNRKVDRDVDHKSILPLRK